MCGSCSASWAVQCLSTAGHHFPLAKALGKLWLSEGCTCSCVTSGQLPSARSHVGCLCSAGSALSELSLDDRLLHGSGLHPKHRVLDDERLCLIGMWPLPSVTRACSADGLCQAEHSCAPAARLWEGREKSSDKSEHPGQLFQQDYVAYNCQGALLEASCVGGSPGSCVTMWAGWGSSSGSRGRQKWEWVWFLCSCPSPSRFRLLL